MWYGQHWGTIKRWYLWISLRAPLTPHPIIQAQRAKSMMWEFGGWNIQTLSSWLSPQATKCKIILAFASHLLYCINRFDRVSGANPSARNLFPCNEILFYFIFHELILSNCISILFHSVFFFTTIHHTLAMYKNGHKLATQQRELRWLHEECRLRVFLNTISCRCFNEIFA